jgi:hypothetical protein
MAMTLEDIYEYLATGELAQVIMGSSAEGNEMEVPKARYRQLRSAIQLGLTDLHKRFLIREETLTVDTTMGPGTYYLLPDYAESNARSKQPVKYILDGANPFKDDLLKVARMYDDTNTELVLNVLGDDKAILTPSNTSFILPETSTTAFITVVYHANHPQINKVLADTAPSTVKIDLEHIYLHALTLFVASRVMNPIGLSGETFHEGNNYFSKYLNAVQELSAQGMAVTRTSTHVERMDPGWI